MDSKTIHIEFCDTTVLFARTTKYIITTGNIPFAVLLFTAKSIEKWRILCYNISTVGLGPAKSTVWKEFMRFFDFIEGKRENDKLGVL